MTVFNGEVLFNGVDANGTGLSGLWVTNGTGRNGLRAGGGTRADERA